MNEEQAALILSQAYTEAEANRNQATSVHLFGIRYADQLAGLSLSEILRQANMPSTYATEIRKGMKLAQFVNIIEQ
ncbi:hypothetical protein BTR14_09505 [Rhizobium rhizosphaerae]|uniref:HTH-like domain-containing protein n=1 Tax=Xaviernesmea rhizosphaerae TaxID=1672749 RepID=A0ABX3PEN0_9HYPH|nr:hypothetical protein [Xaviernesmea rhizosphaerae]OQP86670.1 hypothetical protein BTR14_09505 [Xaviernesmea rhizosphaerae]